MPTKFAIEKLEVNTSDHSSLLFYFDGNGKITRGNGSFENPVPNAFSLVQIKDCPHATPTCKSTCYVNRLEKAEKEIHSAYEQNSTSLRRVLEQDIRISEVALEFSDWIKKNCQGGFRWHVSGDIISERHAIFVRKVCYSAPLVSFWIYTRSFEYLRPLLLAPLPNLVVNLSADKDNYLEAVAVHKDFGLRLCYLTVDGNVPGDLSAGSVIMPSHELRGRDLPDPKEAPWWRSLDQQKRQMVCPADFFGQSEKMRCGPCKKCLV